MINLKTENLAKKIVWLLMLGSFAYTASRSFLLSISHDEAVSFTRFVHRSYMDLLTYNPPSANHHLLNTLGMKFFFSIFGLQEWVIRIPVLIGHFLYITATYQILKKYFSDWKLVLTLGLCLSHPFLLNYFGCARGYGIALGFMVWAIYFSIKQMDLLFAENKSGSQQLFLIAGALALATLANLTFVNVFVLVIIIGSSLEFFNIKRSNDNTIGYILDVWRRAIAPVLPWILFTLAIYLGPVIKLIEMNDFYAGGTKGFWQDTVLSLIRVSIYRELDQASLLFSALKWIGAIIVTWTVYVVLGTCSRLLGHCLSKKSSARFLIWLTAITFSLIVTNLIQFYGFGIRFGIGRTAIYYLPLFLLLMCMVIDRLGDGASRIHTGLIVALLIYFVSCLNWTHFIMKTREAEFKTMMQDVYELSGTKAFDLSEGIRIGTHWASTPLVNYYILQFRSPWIRILKREGADGDYDIYCLEENKNEHLIRKRNLVVLKRYPFSKLILAISQEAAGGLKYQRIMHDLKQQN